MNVLIMRFSVIAQAFWGSAQVTFKTHGHQDGLFRLIDRTAPLYSPSCMASTLKQSLYPNLNHSSSRKLK